MIIHMLIVSVVLDTSVRLTVKTSQNHVLPAIALPVQLTLSRITRVEQLHVMPVKPIQFLLLLRYHKMIANVILVTDKTGQTRAWRAWPVIMLIRWIRLLVYHVVVVFTLHRVTFHGLQLRNARSVRYVVGLRTSITMTQPIMVPAVD
jgi:hypothetical protein